MASFPEEYYRCTTTNGRKKRRGIWFCNRSVSPLVQDKSVSSSDNSISQSNQEGNETEATEHQQNHTPDQFPEQVLENFTHQSDNESEGFDHADFEYEPIDDSVADPNYEPENDVDNECDTDNENDNQNKVSPARESSNSDPEAETSLNIPNISNEMLDCVQHETSIDEQPNIDTNNLGLLKNNGEIRKGNKKKDFCFFCEIMVLNFSRHLQRNHSLETDVASIFSHPPNSIERKRLLEILRKKGNYLNSNVICKPVQTLRSREKLLPCSNCLGFYSASLLWRHRNKCIGKKDRAHQTNAQNLLLSGLKTDLELREMVFPKMRPDEVSLVAKKDPLICAYGSRYLKIHREKHFINVTSRKMRELSRLLIEIKKRQPAVTSLFDALKPSYFDLLVEATKAVARYDAEKDIYESPTYALNMGTNLKQCAQLAIVFALKRKNVAGTVASAENEVDLKTLIQIIESQWQFEISSQASNDLNINKWNKITLVPLASDLRLLKENLVAKANEAIKELQKNNMDQNNYLILLETIYCRLILLNRRRPGELQRLTLDVYTKSMNTDESNYEEFSEVISTSEKILLKRFKRVVIRGKRGRGVPVLICPDVQEHIKVLLSYRQNFINKKNLYLFGNVISLEPICGYKVLRKYAFSCGAKNPKAITSTKLRKHLATLTQVFSMSDNDLEQLAHFMGHTVGVHRGSYRLPDDVYQTAKISKLLLLMEKGKAGGFKGKELNEIELNLEEDILHENNSDNEEPSVRRANSVPSDHQENSVGSPPYVNSPIAVAPVVEENSSRLLDTKGKKRRVLTPWTPEQKAVVTKFFASHIKNKKPPKRTECSILKDKHPDLLKNKDWLKIKVFIQNVYSKKK